MCSTLKNYGLFRQVYYFSLTIVHRSFIVCSNKNELEYNINDVMQWFYFTAMSPIFLVLVSLIWISIMKDFFLHSFILFQLLTWVINDHQCWMKEKHTSLSMFPSPNLSTDKEDFYISKKIINPIQHPLWIYHTIHALLGGFIMLTPVVYSWGAQQFLDIA